MNIAKRIKEILLQSAGIEVEIAQKRLNKDSIEEKVEQINASGSDMFIMLGCDSSQLLKNSGIQIYGIHSAIDVEGRNFRLNPSTKFGLPEVLSYLPYQNLNLILCSLILDEFKNNIPVEVKGVRLAPIFLLKRASMPSALIMLGYWDNPKDFELIKNISFQEVVARSIAGAILNYSNLIEKLNQ
jgi:N-acetylmuramoyl-L-alanine amidase